MTKSYLINGREIKFKLHKFEGKLSIEEYENQIFSSLSKIGIDKAFIQIKYSKSIINPFVEVYWIINRQSFKFRSESQEDIRLNLGAISQAIQEDIRQVTRGIKDLFQMMNQYKVDEFPKIKRTNLLIFNERNNEKKKEKYKKIKKDIETKNNKIDELFPNNLRIVDLNENQELDKKYEYLLKFSKEQLDKMYFRLKEQCILQNKPNHEMFIALKIVRKKKGLEL